MKHTPKNKEHEKMGTKLVTRARIVYPQLLQPKSIGASAPKYSAGLCVETTEQFVRELSAYYDGINRDGIGKGEMLGYKVNAGLARDYKKHVGIASGDIKFDKVPNAAPYSVVLNAYSAADRKPVALGNATAGDLVLVQLDLYQSKAEESRGRVCFGLTAVKVLEKAPTPWVSEGAEADLDPEFTSPDADPFASAEDVPL
jgi:hypothetical protein